MNLLMILLVVLAIWVCAAICYFAWRLMPDVEAPPDPPVETGDAAEARSAERGPADGP